MPGFPFGFPFEAKKAGGMRHPQTKTTAAPPLGTPNPEAALQGPADPGQCCGQQPRP